MMPKIVYLTSENANALNYALAGQNAPKVHFMFNIVNKAKSITFCEALGHSKIPYSHPVRAKVGKLFESFLK